MVYFPQKKEMLFQAIHNVRALPRHVDDIVSDNEIINNGVIGFTETQIKPSDSTFKIIDTLNLIRMKITF